MATLVEVSEPAVARPPRFAYLEWSPVIAGALGAAALCACIARDDRTRARKEAVAARRQRRIAAGLPATATDGTEEDEGNGVAAVARAFVARGKEMASDVGKVLRVPTFIIIVVQGIVGSMPWTALSFLTLYLQMRGFEAVPAATVSFFSFLFLFFLPLYSPTALKKLFRGSFYSPTLLGEAFS